MGGRPEGHIIDPRNKRMGTTENREEWKNFLREARAQKGL
jgi:hypothetical protein